MFLKTIPRPAFLSRTPALLHFALLTVGLLCFTQFRAMAAMVDGNGDGLPDAWAARYGMLATDAGVDIDADGFTALEEARSGTSPRDALSRLDLGLVVGADGIPVMKLDTVLYKRYQVEGSNNLADWQAVGEPIEGDGAQRSVQDTHPAVTPRYYRLRVLEDRDRDGDGMSDWEEAEFYDTSLTTPDSDADGIGDGEDASRARTAEAPANLAILRKIALNTLQVHAPFPGKKGVAMSIRSRQYVASINPNHLASLIQNPDLTH